MAIQVHVGSQRGTPRQNDAGEQWGPEKQNYHYWFRFHDLLTFCPSGSGLWVGVLQAEAQREPFHGSCCVPCFHRNVKSVFNCTFSPKLGHGGF